MGGIDLEAGDATSAYLEGRNSCRTAPRLYYPQGVGSMHTPVVGRMLGLPFPS